MLTALALALMLQQPPHSCATCGAHGGGTEEGATGWFPICSPTGWQRICNICTGPVIGLGTNKVPCPLGAPVPYGDTWAMQMHTNYASTSPASAPTPPPAPTPAGNPPAEGTGTRQPPGGAPASAPSTSPFETPPALPATPATSPLNPLP
jgi:hypothetical protein